MRSIKRILDLIFEHNKRKTNKSFDAYLQVLPQFVPLRICPLSQKRPTTRTTGGFDSSYSKTTPLMFKVRSVSFKEFTRSLDSSWVVLFRSATDTLLGNGTFTANFRVRGTLEDCSLWTMSLLRSVMLRSPHSTWTFSMAPFSFPTPPSIVPKCWVISSMNLLAMRACISSAHCSAR